MTAVFVFARAGKSHSWLTPTISRSNPSANSTSVADGRRETIRIPGLYHKLPPIHCLEPLPAGDAMDSPQVLLVQKILSAHLIVGEQVLRPCANNLRRWR